MSALLFANEEVIVLNCDGEMMRVDTAKLRTVTLIQAASELLAVASGRMQREGKPCAPTLSQTSRSSDSSSA